MGIATTRPEARVAAAMGRGPAPILFESHQAVYNAGVMFLIPALLSQGLLKMKKFYRLSPSDYYQLESVVLTVAIMALCRIKNPEQLKQCKVGDLGKTIGLDRVPELRCLRKKLKQLAKAGQSTALNNALADHWYEQNDSGLLYIDGHNRIYYGKKANLSTKYVSRQKLCLSATTEFWVNDHQGMPLMMVMGQLNEKLQEMIKDSIIPQLKQTRLLKEEQSSDQPRCTLIFDREAYKPAFFAQLWEEERIAIVTYRKNVTDKWEEECFNKVVIKCQGQDIDMHLCEKEITLSGHIFREIRKRSPKGHQTAIITTHPTMETQTIAVNMFNRWTQENFFKYMMADYSFDAIIEYGIEPIDQQKEVVNPVYRKLTNQIKKNREKKARMEAKFYPLVDQVFDQKIDKIPELTQKQAHFKEQITAYQKRVDQLVSERKNTKPRIRLQQMTQDKRYNKLKTESKLLINIIKMICYRAESSLVNLLPNTLKGEKRMCIKQMIQNNADIIPDYYYKTLTVTLHALSANRYNHSISQLCQILNDTQTVFPGTDLVMVFKNTAVSVC